ncbi:MAG TPA: cytochrome c oxidase subunit 3 [Pyrinomonadaceae bacterium]|jgi:cytochrome c oxidase subunit 3
MATTTATTETRERPRAKDAARGLGGARGGPYPPGRGPNGGPNGGRGGPLSDSDGAHFRIGAWVLIAAVVMLFVAFTSAYMFRASMRDWATVELPRVLWLSTALILASSAALEVARRRLRRGERAAYRRWLASSLVLGGAFVVAQLLAWRQLVAAGVYMATNPYSSFFYLLTGLHGLHLLGGLAGLCYLLWRAGLKDDGAQRGRGTARRRAAVVDAVALYWHFMDGLWVYLFALLFLWR